MSLAYIIAEVCEKCGQDATDDRELLLRVINRACKEVYEITDLPDSLREMVVLATENSLISLPYYIGEVRNIRSYFTLERLSFKDMQPKYSFNAWPEIYNTWRVVKKSPLASCIENASAPIIVSMEEIDVADVVITVVGQTSRANRVAEIVTIPAGETSAQLNNTFVDIFSITKTAVNNNNITFTGVDAGGNNLILSVIPNDRLKALYTIIDVSQIPIVKDNNTGLRYVEILYKEPLPTMAEDGDEFICHGFDDAIVSKVCEYFFSEKSDGATKAYGYLLKCNDLITKTLEHRGVTIEKVLQFAPNPLIGLHKRPYLRPHTIY